MGQEQISVSFKIFGKNEAKTRRNIKLTTEYLLQRQLLLNPPIQEDLGANKL